MRVRGQTMQLSRLLRSDLADGAREDESGSTTLAYLSIAITGAKVDQGAQCRVGRMLRRAFGSHA